MGGDLAQRFPVARDLFERIDTALGVALSRIMWEGPEAELVLTHNAQPAILAHSAAVWAVVGERLGRDSRVALGHSLGEYSAYVVGGALSAEAAALLVRRRGELMLEAGAARPGAMAAVLGLATDAVERVCREVSTPDAVAVAANLNAPDQTVLSGDPPAVARAGEACKAAGAKRVIPLKVSGAFHSPLMRPAVAGLTEALAGVSMVEPRIPIVANASATPVTSVAEARGRLAEQLTAPVRWVACVERAAALAPGATFVEIGPGNVLSGLVRKILPQAKAVTLGTADEVEQFLAG
jgi:[acyl-carrier-protein] S-malonyltransferase